MKKFLIGLLVLLPIGAFLQAQTLRDSLMSNCLFSTGQDSKYLKDFRIQLGQSVSEDTLRYKVTMSLWKNTRYRFTLCTSESSKGQLILNILDETNKMVLSSVDTSTGTLYNSVDLICNKSGVYQIYFDFTQGQTGSGVGIVSMVQ